MENNRKLSASCLVIKDNQVLLVKHTYGAAKGKYLISGGFSEEGEMPQTTGEREVLEETGVRVQANELIAVRFTPEEVWCIFKAEYIEGTPTSDHMENDTAIFMPLEEAIHSDHVVTTTQELIKSALTDKPVLQKSAFANSNYAPNTWQLFI